MAESSFNRILTLLRKERGITQKQAAEALGVSQALLSHYEKGIRECGLDFVVRAADFYGVSCDYLLGRSPDRSGLTLMVEDIPDEPDSSDKRYTGSVLSTLNKKLITNSLNILFGMLQKCPDSTLVGEVSAYLMAAVYRMFRLIYGANPKNNDGMFRISRPLHSGYAESLMARSFANAGSILDGEKLPGQKEAPTVSVPHITTEELNKDYPLYATSLFNLVQHIEKRLEL